MTYILKNIELNLNKLENYSIYPDFKDNVRNAMKHIEIDILNRFELKIIKDDLKVPQSALDYFKDFGIEFLYEIECININCLIF